MEEQELAKIVPNIIDELKSQPSVSSATDWQQVREHLEEDLKQRSNAEHEAHKWLPDPPPHSTFDSRAGA